MDVAFRAAGYLNEEPTIEFIQRIVRWMVETKSTRFTQDAIQYDIAPDIIADCIERNKPLRPYRES
jgi:hypothetical protein